MAGLRIAKGRSKTRQALTAEQVELLADAVGPVARPFVLVLAYCGLRPGEAIALRRRHLDDLGRLTIQGAVTEQRGRSHRGDTKTHRSRLAQVPESVLARTEDAHPRARRRSPGCPDLLGIGRLDGPALQLAPQSLATGRRAGAGFYRGSRLTCSGTLRPV